MFLNLLVVLLMLIVMFPLVKSIVEGEDMGDFGDNPLAQATAEVAASILVPSMQFCVPVPCYCLIMYFEQCNIMIYRSSYVVSISNSYVLCCYVL